MDPKSTITSSGDQILKLDKLFNRINGHAVIHPDSAKTWYQNGNHNQLNDPAKIFPDGIKCWFLNNKLHREDGPAIIYPNGSVEYWAFHIRYESLEDLIIGVVMNQ